MVARSFRDEVGAYGGILREDQGTRVQGDGGEALYGLSLIEVGIDDRLEGGEGVGHEIGRLAVGTADHDRSDDVEVEGAGGRLNGRGGLADGHLGRNSSEGGEEKSACCLHARLIDSQVT